MSRQAPRADITYFTDIGIAPYFAFFTSFPPNAGTYVTDSKTALLTDPAKPSDARQVEGGVKFQPRGGNSFVTASVFPDQPDRRAGERCCLHRSPGWRSALSRCRSRGHR